MQYPSNLNLLRRLLVITRGNTVKRSTATYLVQQGWKLTNGGVDQRWDGYYRTRFGSFKGKIERLRTPRFFIHNPPEAMRRHSHWICFTDQGAGWHAAHFSRLPKDLDSGVMAIERIIHESFILPKKTAAYALPA